ncbi:MAG: TonB-dependent receptor [Bryobacteraceae bacterium]
MKLSLVGSLFLGMVVMAQEPRKESVVVTGTYDPLPLSEADRSLKVVDVGALSLLSNTPFDLLRLDSSLDLRERAGNGVQSDLSIRGGSFGQTLVTLNGIRLNDPQSGHHNMDVPVPPEAVERIEVLHGAGSTFYGSDAVGGVVNFIAAKPEVSEFRLRTAVGNWGVNQQRGSISGVRGNWTEQLTFSRDFSTGFQPDRDYRNLSLGSISHFKSKLGFTDLILAYSDRPFGADQFYGNYNSWERTKSWFASVRQELGSKTEVAFAYRRHTDLFVLYRDRPEVFTNRHLAESWDGAVRRRESLGQNVKLHYGAEVYADSIVSTNLGQHDRIREAGYVSLDVRALRRFSFSVGAREEIFRNFQRQLSPSAHGGLWVSQRLRLRGGASRAFRLPSFTDLYYHDPANLGSPNLKPEKAWNYEGGLDWNAGGRVKGDVTVFQRRERDGIDYVRYTPTDVWRATNFQRLTFSGVEASVVTTVARKQRVEVQYTGLRGGQEARGAVFSKYAFNYPEHTGIVSWQGELPGGLVARTRVGATKRYARGVYGVWDVYLAYGRGRVHPYAQFTNLTDTRYQEVLGVGMPGRGVVVGIDILAWRGH